MRHKDKPEIIPRTNSHVFRMVNYSKFFSDVALARKPSPIRVLTAIQAAAGPEMISLAGGQPNPLLFPINAVSFDIGKRSTNHVTETGHVTIT